MNKLTHYIEIEAIPQIEIAYSEVMSFAMQTLHKVLPSFEGRIGLGFPQYQRNYGLGRKIRIFGSEDDLTLLLLKIDALKNYFIINEIAPIPEKTTAGRYQRIQHKGKSALRRAEKRMKHRKEFSAEILEKMEAKQAQIKRYPHVFLKSSSTHQAKMLLEIRQIICSKPNEGQFTGYGLSQAASATVPHF